MDPLSTIASITAIVRLGEKVVGYITDVRKAPKASNRILIEISSINGLLFGLQNLIGKAESGDTRLPITRLLGIPNGPLAQFKSALERLKICLEPVASAKLTSTLNWPFKEKEIKEILGTLERQKTLFIFAMENDHMYS